MIHNLNNLNVWRRVILLSATFLIAILVGYSCKKKNNPIGEGVLPPGSSLESGGIDTFSLRTYSTVVDTVISMNPRYNLVGQFDDVEVGYVNASFYTQLSLSGFSPDFGDFSKIKVDSLVLAFRYGGYYGDPIEELFEVYEIAEDLHEDSTYYSFSTVPTKTQNLVPTANNEGLLKPDPLKPSVVGNDTIEPQLRIPMDTLFGRQLMQLAAESPSNEVFLEGFKGLHVKVNKPRPSRGRGAVYYLESTAPSSKMTVYYSVDDTVKANFDFLISNQLVDFNHMEFDMTGSPLEKVIQDTIPGQEQFYAQAFQARAKVEFPTVSDIPENIVLHNATLELPISYFTGNNFYPSSSVTVGAKLFEGDEQVFLINDNVEYNAQLRAYIVNLRPYIQSVINGEVINDGLIISPRFFNTTTERIIFNGSKTMNKMKPKLRIVYTEF